LAAVLTAVTTAVKTGRVTRGAVTTAAKTAAKRQRPPWTPRRPVTTSRRDGSCVSGA